MKYKHKLITSGNILELYSYEKEVRTGKDAEREENNGRRGNGKVEDWDLFKQVKKKNREDSLVKAKKNLRRLINANVDQWGETTKFLTLTYSENFQDIKQSNYNFNKFIKRINYQLDIKLKYSCVIEFQKRGAIHYHLVTYNLPYIDSKILEEIWSHGFIKVNKVDEVDNVGAYVTKYMTKDNRDPRLEGEKCYFNSRGLKKPVETIINEKEIETLRESLSPKEVYSSDFENEYLGRIHYSQVNLNR